MKATRHEKDPRCKERAPGCQDTRQGQAWLFLPWRAPRPGAPSRSQGPRFLEHSGSERERRNPQALDQAIFPGLSGFCSLKLLCGEARRGSPLSPRGLGKGNGKKKAFTFSYQSSPAHHGSSTSQFPMTSLASYDEV